MALIGVRGDSKQVNSKIIFDALEKEPTLVIDCANCANPHKYYPFVNSEVFRSTFVVEVEMLYKLRDVIKNAPKMARRIGVGSIFVTTFHRLFAYDNKEENKDVYEHAWILLSNLATEFNVLVGVHEAQEVFAKKYCHEIVSC
jgi:hypothetical protein